MNADFSNSAEWKKIGTDFKDVFSDKDFQDKNSSYPYSSEYFRDRQKEAVRMMRESGITALNNLGEIHLGGSSGSEAVRQARLNVNDVDKKPNKVEIENNNRKLNND